MSTLGCIELLRTELPFNNQSRSRLLPQVAVAAQQFQAKGCSDVEFGLYCATVPTVATSRGLRFSCWMGAYPGLAAHFNAAGLNPMGSNWDKARLQSNPDGNWPRTPALGLNTMGSKKNRESRWVKM